MNCNNNNTCPICLDEIHESDNFLCMPVCMHKIHTKCELKAAQYDARCPVCRTKDPEITSRREDDTAIYSSLERLATEHTQHVRNYNQRRSRAINKNSALKKLRERLKNERKQYMSAEKRLESAWLQHQKRVWNSDPDIVRLKNERKKCQRKTSLLCKKFEKELEEKVGPKPDDVIFNINLESLSF